MPPPLSDLRSLFFSGESFLLPSSLSPSTLNTYLGKSFPEESPSALVTVAQKQVNKIGNRPVFPLFLTLALLSTLHFPKR